MKVKDLVPGMIVRPIINKYTKKRMIFDVRKGVALGKTSESHVDVVLCSASKKATNANVAIYVGTEVSTKWVAGVKTHHYLLVDGRKAIISGYEVRYLEAV